MFQEPMGGIGKYAIEWIERGDPNNPKVGGLFVYMDPHLKDRGASTMEPLKPL